MCLIITMKPAATISSHVKTETNKTGRETGIVQNMPDFPVTGHSRKNLCSSSTSLLANGGDAHILSLLYGGLS